MVYKAQLFLDWNLQRCSKRAAGYYVPVRRWQRSLPRRQPAPNGPFLDATFITMYITKPNRWWEDDLTELAGKDWEISGKDRDKRKGLEEAFTLGGIHNQKEN
ncbi:hypothetical protein ACJJTC_012270 [Scirpophaga incertulas]